MKNKKTITSRAGFTLLELLIVVGIISLLTALSVVVMSGIAEQANEEATVATIRKLNGLIEARVESFDRAFAQRGTFYNKYVAATNALLQQKNIYGVRPEVVDVLARKVAFRHNFPQRFEDLLKLSFAPNGITALTDFDGDVIKPSGRVIDADNNGIPDVIDRTAVQTASNLGATNVTGDDETIGAELLYWFLNSSGGLSREIASDRFSASEVADTDNDGLLEFVDAWGNPLRFYRWPTRMIDDNPPTPFQPFLASPDPTDLDPVPNDDPDDDNARGREITKKERTDAQEMMKGLPPQPTELPNSVLPRDLLLTDPDDPIGRLYSEMERLDGSNGKPLLSSEYNEVWYHTPETYHTPLIVSAGTDEVLGLFEPSDTANGGHLATLNPSEPNGIEDNLTNRNRRAGGRR